MSRVENVDVAVLSPAGSSRATQGLYAQAFRRLVKEKPLGFVGLVIVVVLAVAALIAPLAAISGPNALDGSARLLSPSWSHPFGTDNLGRDVYSRVVWGARISITIGLIAVSISTVLSMLIGVASGFYGRITDMLLQRVVDAVIAFPGLVFILGIVAIFRGYQIPGLPKEGVFSTTTVVLMVVIGFLGAFGSSRVIRSAVLSEMGRTYIEAARALGATNSRLMWTHVMPNILPPAITIATLGLGGAILLESTLSFLGLGVPPDVATWGGMLNREARAYMTEAWWLAVFPGVALSLTVFGFNMLGDALRDVLDPRQRG
ncbi:MAG: ABC transporter permease [Chloroflexi bacterium]|nr:ABC transporter permease [Chloroflexota bacterium]MDA1002739.1 ABC transporter permease [Chloroflexota bacterium]